LSTQKLRRKYDSNQKQFVTLQAMVHQELQTGTHNAKDSATDALLWLKRAMEFIQVFLSEVAAGEHDLAVAAGKIHIIICITYKLLIRKGIQ